MTPLEAYDMGRAEGQREGFLFALVVAAVATAVITLVGVLK